MQKIYSIQSFWKKLAVYIFLKAEMTANYAKIDRVGSSDAGFQVPHAQNF